ncbi:HNH endonuclease [Neobacillus piezotolerans]|uniref:HNH endonuclease n=1 Tax=Neobacillus piezotolerans TaxID=2259171 RepID=A0A3D8GT19_9BACI|nr:RNA-guided endonuclease IscB [Neobacillus piezotolerans]RDU37462.1 HNH endonuclease [Neobacillus piezotolerans]
MTHCFVLDAQGRKLSPTKEKRAWYLIRKQKAILKCKFPMVIQLVREVPEEEIDTTPIHLGIDDGSKLAGIALVQECGTENKPVFKGTIELRIDVKEKLAVRRGHRRYRRQHKKYRPARFDNRSSSRKEGRIPPSIRQKKDSVLRVVRQLTKWVRIDQIFLEDVLIDNRALEKGYKPYRWEYQQRNRLDENIRKAAILRDRNTCQDCGATNTRMEVHHITPRRLHGSDSIHNLITLCSKCHEKIAGEELLHSQRFYQKIKGKSISFRDAMHVMQGKTYLQKALREIAPLNLTTGGDTANKRIDWDIEKTHANDSIVICNLRVNPEQCEMKDWVIKPMKKRSSKKIKSANGIYHRDFVRYTKRNGESYIAYITALYPERNQCNMTTIDGKVLKRYGLSRLSLLWRFNRIYWLINSNEGGESW